MSVTSNSLICYNWMPMIADHCLDFSGEFYESAGVSRLHNKSHFNPEDVKAGDIVFVKTDYLYKGYFQYHVFPKIKNPFILISGISSYHIGSNGKMSYVKMLKSPKLIKWFCTNPPDFNDDKVVPLPIGFQERERLGGNQKLLTECLERKTKVSEKKERMLLPYHNFDTNPQRKRLFDFLSNLSFVDVQPKKLSWIDYLKLVDKYKFVACLEGSGPDVHRNYESLLVDTIPVNIKNVIEKLFDYHQLPGVFIESWDDMTNVRFETICGLNYNFKNSNEFLKIGYHIDLIKKIRDSFIGSFDSSIYKHTRSEYFYWKLMLLRDMIRL